MRTFTSDTQNLNLLNIYVKPCSNQGHYPSTEEAEIMLSN